MAKFLLVVSVGIVIFVLSNYSNINSKTSYLIILCCFFVIAFSGSKVWSDIHNPDDNENFENFEKKLNEIHHFDGMFKYSKDGFTFIEKGIQQIIQWNDILEVNSFTISSVDSNTNALEIVTEKKNYIFYSYTPGIVKLYDKLFENLPNWKLDEDFVTVSYGTKKANLYTKKEDSNV